MPWRPRRPGPAPASREPLRLRLGPTALLAVLLAAAITAWAGPATVDARLAALPLVLTLLASAYALRERRIRPYELGRLPVGPDELRLARLARWVFEPAGAGDIAVRLESTPFESSAAFVGLHRPVLLVSERFAARFGRGSIDEDAALAVMLHERAHCEGHDVAHRVLARVAVRLAVGTALAATLLLPWCPSLGPGRALLLWVPAVAVHWGATRLARLLEWRADERATGAGGGPGLAAFFEGSAVEDRLGALARPCEAHRAAAHEEELAGILASAVADGDDDMETAARRLIALHGRWSEHGPRRRRLAAVAWDLDHAVYWIRRHPPVEARVRRLRSQQLRDVTPPSPGGS